MSLIVWRALRFFFTAEMFSFFNHALCGTVPAEGARLKLAIPSIVPVFGCGISAQGMDGHWPTCRQMILRTGKS
jgi:hypothetical protein